MAFKNYIELLKAQNLPKSAKTDSSMEISLDDEKKTVMSFI